MYIIATHVLLLNKIATIVIYVNFALCQMRLVVHCYMLLKIVCKSTTNIDTIQLNCKMIWE